MSQNISSTPVLLLTGFLGSGKTTLVNKILFNRKGIKFAVIVNDIGEINIDAELIQRGGVVTQQEESLVALENGCICCSLKMDLVEQVNGLLNSGRFDYIVIEASGICEPAPIALTVEQMTDARMDCIVSIVDALRLKSEFNCGETLDSLLIEQIEFCNMVLLNKASEVSREELGRIRHIIHHLQPKAEIIECDYCEIELDSILNTGLFEFDKVATSAAWIQAIEGDEDEHEHEHEHHHHDHSHCDHEHGHCVHDHVAEYGISTFVYYRRPALDLNKFDHFVARKWPQGIIRAKGICYFSDDIDKCYIFEQAGPQKTIKDAGLWYATMPREELAEMMLKDPKLARDWDPAYGDRMVKIVFIGRDMDTEALSQSLDDCSDS